MPQERVQRKLAAVLAADVVGYSRLMGADEVGTHVALKACRHVVIDPKVTEHCGRIVKSTGDGILADFASVVDAVVCAVEIQRTMAERNADQPPHTRIDLRIGINLGDVIVDDGDIYGDGVNVAVRVEGIADRGGIAVSGKVYEEVHEKVDISFKYDGEYDVKNITKPVLIYRVLIEQPKARRIEPILDEPALRQSEGPIIAVLPFENLSRAHSWERFAAGISDEIITNLARYPDLLVIARNSTLAYKGKPIDMRRIGRELNADYVLEGSIQAIGKRLRVTAQLIDARSGTHVWAERYDRTTVDLFHVQDDIVECVAGALGGFQGEILRSERRKLVRKHRRACAPMSCTFSDMRLRPVWTKSTRLERYHCLNVRLSSTLSSPEPGRSWAGHVNTLPKPIGRRIPRSWPRVGEPPSSPPPHWIPVTLSRLESSAFFGVRKAISMLPEKRSSAL
jgi:adenylate cyclase